jgi:UDP-N-acetylmuramyl pentapeptide phosphotransferase/UDP-N-acetylglucosamine-1-phosphate transferase
LISASAAPAVAALVAGGLIALILKGRLGAPLDRPNERSLHSQPVPRSGGLPIMVGVLAAFLLLPAPIAIAVPAFALACVSLVDDWRGLPIAIRLSVHAAAAAAYAWLALGALPWWTQLAAALAVLWMTNLYNFMDGSDGLAGGMTVLGFGFLGFAASPANDAIALAAFCIAAAALAFLVFNFHPARIFMGDVGSIPLGFMAAAFGLLGWQRGLWPLWFPAAVFSPFIVDASATLVKRILCGERFWEPHREHYYQRLVRLGWGHRKTALAEYALMLFCGMLSHWALGRPLYLQLIVIMTLATLFVCLAASIDLAWRRASGRAPGSHHGTR